jgi:DNA polymerase III alpha subunit
MGLEAIKNVSRPCIEVILKVRAEEGPFTDYADFIRSVCGSQEEQTVTKTAI